VLPSEAERKAKPVSHRCHLGEVSWVLDLYTFMYDEPSELELGKQRDRQVSLGED
jgi:hypothetical protein